MVAVYRIEILASPGIVGTWKISHRIAPVVDCDSLPALNVTSG